MPFPLSFKGRLDIPVKEGPGKAAAALEGVIEVLKKEQARNLTVIGTEVRFTGGLFRLAVGSRLTFVTSARVTCAQENGAVVLRYEVSLAMEQLVWTLMMAAGTLFLGATRLTPLTWAWLVCMIYASVRFTFPRLLKTAAWAGLDAAADFSSHPTKGHCSPNEGRSIPREA